MKNCTKLLILLIAALFIVSCLKSDDNNETNTGTLCIDCLKYNLNHGEIVKINTVIAGEIYVGLIYILSSDYIYSNTTITGTGQAIELKMYFNSLYTLLPGTYSLKNDEPYQVETFTLNLYKDLNVSTMDITALYKAISGNIIVTKNEATYELNIDVLADKYNITHADTEPTESPIATNIHITCTYKGDLTQKYLSK